ncbi:hypothetical protein [Spirilliplanes yamanashiensis]|uniref:Uncharacterized protein n=1 Tax=Spirilliplanes yamanashiensis TaxID=42233 RepID=A0A8J4DIZ1_9ACTN|nr:hypothetical protein [Spirilliplanes yamanashiensis]MDP9817110.1 hypothetical protein [Spirilliplanes yamanashiensis]GIJ03236.1 hypothetical protein Sya03_25880 [Spirilliplanes yamanashiensis]
MRRTAIAAAVAALVTGAGLTTGTPAQAYDGRAVSPQGELRSIYLHALDRQPHRAARDAFLPPAARDCRAGVLRFSFDVLTSPAVARHLPTAGRRTSALYLSLLDRAPDTSGWAAHTAMSKAAGLERATVDVMMSAEYRNRLTRLCAGLPSGHAAVYSPDEIAGVVQTLLLSTTVAPATCAVTGVVGRMRAHRGRAGLASVAAYSGQLATAAVGTNPTCRFAQQIALGAAWAASIAATGHPVYIGQSLVTTTAATTRTAHYTFTIGRDPAGVRTFTGSVTAPKA